MNEITQLKLYLVRDNDIHQRISLFKKRPKFKNNIWVCHSCACAIILNNGQKESETLKLSQLNIKIEPGEIRELPLDLTGEIKHINHNNISELIEIVPQTYGEAVIKYPWIDGHCESHEWRNRTTIANAVWLIKKLLKKGCVKVED